MSKRATPLVGAPRRRPPPHKPATPPDAAAEFAAGVVRALQVAEFVPRMARVADLLEKARAELDGMQAPAADLEALRETVDRARMQATMLLAPLQAQISHLERGRKNGRRVFEHALLRELAARGFSLAARRWVMQTLRGDGLAASHTADVHVRAEDERAKIALATLEQEVAARDAELAVICERSRQEAPEEHRHFIDDIEEASRAQHRHVLLGRLHPDGDA